MLPRRPRRASNCFPTPAADWHLDPDSGHLSLAADSLIPGSWSISLTLNLMEWLVAPEEGKTGRLGHPAECVKDGARSVEDCLNQTWGTSASF